MMAHNGIACDSICIWIIPSRIPGITWDFNWELILNRRARTSLATIRGLIDPFERGIRVGIGGACLSL